MKLAQSLIASVAGLFLLATVPGHAAELVVGPGMGYESIEEALAAAVDGSVIRINGGTHTVNLVIDKSVTIEGHDTPVVDGGGQGTVIKITAPDVQIRGLTIRNSGSALNDENSGISIEAPGALIEDCLLEEMLFGIYLKKAAGSIIRNNRIFSMDLPPSRRGDPIRVWYSDSVQIRGNTVEKGRDVVLWYSSDLVVADNSIQNSRYGLHFMYCDRAEITGNIMSNNSVGAFLMYSRKLRLTDNVIIHNRGATGFGIGLKDMDDPYLAGNIIADNQIGIYVDNSPREIDSSLEVEENLIAFNDIGVQLKPSVRRNVYLRNDFVENTEQVRITKGAPAEANRWEKNYWSDYRGFDLDGDGYGDQAHEPKRLFEKLLSEHSLTQLYKHSPTASALDWAARTMPILEPEPKLVDKQPRIEPLGLSVPASQQAASGSGLGFFAAALIAGAFSMTRAMDLKRLAGKDAAAVRVELLSESILKTENVDVHFGNTHAVRNVSLNITPGECVALWGGNGAGKTTLLRALNGLIASDGSIRINGLDPKRELKKVKTIVGYLPQDPVLYDELTGYETLNFFARLRHDRPDTVYPILERLGIRNEMGKRIKELSGGMRQKLAFSLSLLGDPEIFFFDEPTTNLDVAAREHILEMISEIKGRGKTVLFTSHRFDEVNALANRMIVLEDGAIASEREISAEADQQSTVTLKISAENPGSVAEILRKNGIDNATVSGTEVSIAIELLNCWEPINILLEHGVEIDGVRFSKEDEDA